MSGADVEVRRPTGALAVTDDQTAWNEHQLAALAQAGVADAPTGDQLVFLHQAQRTGLDPFSNQICMIGRQAKEKSRLPNGNWVERYVMKWTIQTRIDGYRVIARRAAKRDGDSYSYDEPLWCGQDRKWFDVWVDDTPPAAAKFRVVKTDRHGRVERFTAVARWGSYVQTNREGTPTSRWANGGDQMLSKCAEALALRMAYPQDLSGIYTDEEMMQADNPPQVIDAAPIAPPNGHPNGNGHHPNGPPPANGDGHPPPAGPPPTRTDEERAGFDAWWQRQFDAADTAERLAKLLADTRKAVGDGYLPPDGLPALEQLIRNRWNDVPITQKQLAALHARMAEFGIKGDAEIRAVCWHAVDHCAGSRTKLTYGQYRQILAVVKEAGDGGTVDGLLSKAMSRAWDEQTGEEIDWPEPQPGDADSQFADPAEVS